VDTTKLAVLGGSPVREKPFGIRRTVGEKEMAAVEAVLKKGDISLFFGSPGDFFLGGPYVKAFESKWAKQYGFQNCISVNSWTTGLVTALGAVGIEPGDEVICTPYSMSATATSILFYGGIPVFVDVEDKYFNLDPQKIEEKITPRTKAIMLVHLFGHPADMDPILKIAKKHNLKVVEDGAQAPGAKYKGKYVGAIGDIGGFSLNYHKHIHTGEGGLIVTNDDDLAMRCRLIRNHGENCIEAYEIKDFSNVIGSNYRLTEIQAAIGAVQMDLVEEYVNHRNDLAAHLTKQLNQFDCIEPAAIQDGCRHSFYVYPFKYKQNVHGVKREVFVKAVLAELPTPEVWEQTPLVGGYVRPLYLNPVYQKKMALGKKGFPWSMNPGVQYDYAPGLCPVVERLYGSELIHTPLVREAVNRSDIDDFARAIEKVITNIRDLRE